MELYLLCYRKIPAIHLVFRPVAHTHVLGESFQTCLNLSQILLLHLSGPHIPAKIMMCLWNTDAPGGNFKTRHVFVKHGCPRRQQSQNMAKISKSYILTPPQSQGHVTSGKCEQPLDELTVQLWLLYYHPNFKYCTL